MCMPFKCIREGNYPLPFFLKYDDVEYALRCGLKIITLNGVGVWHEKFEKKYNSASEYYNTRNYLHLCKLQGVNIDAEKWVKKQVSAKEKRQQYKMADAVRLGYEDFLKGLDWLKSVNAEKNHQLICKLNYEFLSYDEIEKRYGVRPDDNRFYHFGSKRTLLNPKNWFNRRYVFVDYFYDLPIQYLGAKNAVHCDSERNCGYITYKNKSGDYS